MSNNKKKNKTTQNHQANQKKNESTVKTNISQEHTEAVQTASKEEYTKEISRKATILRLRAIKAVVLSALKIAVPVAACVAVIVVVVALVQKKNDVQQVEDVVASVSATSASAEESTMVAAEELEEDAYPELNAMLKTYYQALADGDMDTVLNIKDYVDETQLLTAQKKSEYIESYENLKCYTKKGAQENSYYVYATYDIKFNDYEAMAPGLSTMYVYTAEDGSLKIDGDLEPEIEEGLIAANSQEDVIDLVNKVDVQYKESRANHADLDAFLTELPNQLKTSVGIALAQLEAHETDAVVVAETQETESSQETQSQEIKPTQVVNQQVKATDTVNVRSSDSAEADKVGRVESGTILTRTEERINGWSKVVYEGKDAYIKSDYLEVISTEAEGEVIGTVTAKTNVNVRNKPDQSSEKLGMVSEGSNYNLLEDLGEWLRIDFNGKNGYVKEEFFTKS